jgi:hypothetical protein
VICVWIFRGQLAAGARSLRSRSSPQQAAPAPRPTPSEPAAPQPLRRWPPFSDHDPSSAFVPKPIRPKADSGSAAILLEDEIRNLEFDAMSDWNPSGAKRTAPLPAARQALRTAREEIEVEAVRLLRKTGHSLSNTVPRWMAVTNVLEQTGAIEPALLRAFMHYSKLSLEYEDSKRPLLSPQIVAQFMLIARRMLAEFEHAGVVVDSDGVEHAGTLAPAQGRKRA